MNVTRKTLFFTIVVLLSGWYRRWLAHYTRKASVESRVIQTARGPVEVDIRGNGPVVLHFHGGNVGHNGWFMLAHLLDKGFQVLTPDRPGYLGTPLADKGTPEAQADLMAALLDELNVERVAVVGVSAGGPAALQFALLHPGRTSDLVLLSAITRCTSLSNNQTMQAQPPYVLISSDDLAWLHQAKAILLGRLDNPPALLELARAVYLNDHKLKAGFKAVDLVPEHHGITAPTLIIHGEQNGTVPVAQAKRATKHISQSQLRWLSTYWHHPMTEQPDAYFETLLAFVA